MSEEETNQPQTEEANQPPVATPTGEAGASVDGAQEPNAAVEESWTPERIRELQEKAEKYESLEPEYRRVTQEKAEFKRQNEQLLPYYNHAMGQQRAQADPVEAAKQAYVAAKENEYTDPVGAQNALDNYLAVREQRVAQVAAHQALHATNVRDQMKDARRYGDYTEAQITEGLRTITADEGAALLALREGKLPQVFDRERKEADDRAARANAAPSIVGGHGRRVPGSAHQEADANAPVEVPASVWFGFPENVANKKWPNATIVPG